jgi:hypothetical protein
MTLPRATAPGLLLALALAAAGTGCTRTTGFTVEREVFVDAARGQRSPAVTVLPVDLTASGDAWINRQRLQGVSLGEVSAAIASVDWGNAASRASGTVALRPDGAPPDGSRDVTLASFDDAAVQAGSPLRVAAPPAAAALIGQALRSTGRFSLVVRTVADTRPAGFGVGVRLQVHVRYAAPLVG